MCQISWELDLSHLHESSPVLCFYNDGWLQKCGLQISLAPPMIFLVALPDSPMSEISCLKHKILDPESSWHSFVSLQCFVHHSISVPKAAPGVFGSPTTSKTSLKARVDHVVLSSRLLNHPMCTALWLFLFLRSSGFPRRCKICRVEIKLPYLLFVKSSLQNNCSNEKPPFSFWEHLCSPPTHILVLFDFCKPRFLDLRAVSVLMDRLIYLCSQSLVCQWDFF